MISKSLAGTRLQQAWTRTRALVGRRCAICSLASNADVCAGCDNDFMPRDALRCPRCAIALQMADPARDSVCGRCLADDPHYDATLVLGDYVPPMDGMVAALKFSARLELASLFGRLLAARLRHKTYADTIVIGVPLSFERQSERGYNQALEIARSLARHRDLPLDQDSLLRVRHAPPQQLLKLDARRSNVRGAFALRTPISAAHALVVDDVMTSGSTLDEIAKVLKRGGVTRVTNVVVARTP